MTSLHITLRRRGRSVSYGAIAEVRKVSEPDGSPPEKPFKTLQAISVSSLQTKRLSFFTEIRLPSGGRYSVTARLPDGKEYFDEVDAEEDVDTFVTLGIQPVSPDSVKGQAGREVLGFRLRVPEFRSVDLQVITTRRIVDRDDPTAGFVTSYLPSDELGPAGGWSLRRTPYYPISRFEVYPSGRKRNIEWMLEMPDLHDTEALLQTLREPQRGYLIDRRFPRWMEFYTGRQRYLASVPWMWWGLNADRSQSDGIKISYVASRVQKRDDGRNGSSPRIEARDVQWGGLLDFIASGRMTDAAQLIDDLFDESTAQNALYGKQKGPLSAVAGALILVAKTLDGEPRYWDDWLENLANWFPGMPDGAVLLAYRCIQKGRYHEAERWLSEAVARGIPYFAATLHFLSVALSQLEQDELLARIAPVASRVDPGQPFTVIRLPS
ncbi:hypothetical protein J3P71_20890 [Rhizobium leguminosarum]|uniref:hypothetical protein n=1 Tax=Rhizobium leguminosarum TaxID=384 RepID=UPI0014422877|nr:hypothetical protein [Rhizobium leguminosarum]MBY5841304.1 hypothetical protein [Rhizobium leguminosarum]NKM80937.1 hypothetical protein [Rhizobium leguminosarum bv. viciae]QSZ07287.1 hypothetical protein J3P71_20890 [Rhizobium leguminosarum]